MVFEDSLNWLLCMICTSNSHWEKSQQSKYDMISYNNAFERCCISTKTPNHIDACYISILMGDKCAIDKFKKVSPKKGTCIFRCIYWSTFWKSIFKHQLSCRFDILDSISSFFCMLAFAIIYGIHHIIFWIYLYFLNILYFSSTPVLTSSIDVVSVLSIKTIQISGYTLAPIVSLLIFVKLKLCRCNLNAHFNACLVKMCFAWQNGSWTASTMTFFLLKFATYYIPVHCVIFGWLITT